RADEYRAVFGKEFADVYAAEISSLAEQESDGLVEIGSDGSVKVLPLGRLLVRSIAAVFDAWLDKDPAGRAFSRAV
ncbi:MAG: coproporphyrinogen III oxidase, partial [bacterium]|nr:coproporphyrinogen III oxidase [bacterium]